jgi:hypothetical protein
MVEKRAFDPVSGQAAPQRWNHDIGEPAFFPHKLVMVVTGFMALAAAAAATQAQPMPTRAASASLSVGATVVRPEPQPVVAVRRGAVTVSNAGGVIVSAEGGIARRLDGGTILVTPLAGGAMRVTFTY